MLPRTNVILSHAVTKSLQLLVALLSLGSASLSAQVAPSAVPLKDAYRGAFLVGGTLNANQFSGRDSAGAMLVRQQFNAISPENVLKWESVHPSLGTFDWSNTDRYVQWGEDNRMFVVGHTLVWHSQTPRWVFQNADASPVSRDTLVERMRHHIHSVVGRYKRRIHGWDVVNEALNEDGTLRQTPWYRIIGEEYLAMAFRFAAEADSNAQLWYNDYSLENPAKRAGAVRLVKSLLDKGIKVHGVGIQAHHKMDWPTPAAEDSTIKAFAALGVKVMITELDIDVLPRATQTQSADVNLRTQGAANANPYAAGLPDSVQQALGQRYADFFAVYLSNRDVIDRVTFWGVADGDSWLNNWPVRGRSNYPLLFDRNHRPKPAFDAVVRVVRRAPPIQPEDN